jgi:hypothetical protein
MLEKAFRMQTLKIKTFSGDHVPDRRLDPTPFKITLDLIWVYNSGRL